MRISTFFVLFLAAGLLSPAVAQTIFVDGFEGGDFSLWSNVVGGPPPEPPVGEIQVNTYTLGDQREPAVAAEADGDFVVVWHAGVSADTDTNLYSIWAQRFSSSGAPRGDEFQVNTYTTGFQWYPDVDVDSDGEFMVVWSSGVRTGGERPPQDVKGRRYDSDGSPIGDEFEIAPQVQLFDSFSDRIAEKHFDLKLERPIKADVAYAAGGEFVVVWGRCRTSRFELVDISGRRYDSAGASIGDEFSIANRGRCPTVDAAADGEFVVEWLDYGVLVRRYASDGTSLGPAFNADAIYGGNGPIVDSEIKVEPDGDFILTWDYQEYGGDSKNVAARLFTSDGSPIGADFLVNSWTTDDQKYPSIAIESDGSFIIVWASDNITVPGDGFDTDVWRVQAQRFASDGSPQGGEFQVNTYTTGAQNAPHVASSASGDVVVVWHSEVSFDERRSEVVGRRYDE